MRSLIDCIHQAFVSCLANRLRTALSGVAIAVAVATISVIFTGLDGFSKFAGLTAARTFGSDTFILSRVLSTQLSRKELALLLQRNQPIRRGDTRFLDRYSEDQVIYAPVVQTRADISAGSRKFERASLSGTGPDMFKIRDLGISRGRFFTEAEAQEARFVAIVGAEIAETLFPGTDPLGGKIRIEGRAFQIVGLQSPQGTAGGISLDRYAWIPLKAYERLFGTPETLQVYGKAVTPGMTEAAEDLTRAIMRARRQLRPGEDDTFEILSPEAARNFVLVLSQRIGAAGIPISVAALLAAIVVVTNTSLVSVTQRTREIGIRRALGATRARITSEVLIESILIAVIGGTAGITAAHFLLAAGGEALALELPLETHTALWSLAAAGISGLVAGLYPARWASRIDVVNAIRMD